ncbi:MAG: pyruvate kinase [Phycisphaerales bacterium]|nr:pyruvate kinase [Phycisphaerales bacterium]
MQTSAVLFNERDRPWKPTLTKIVATIGPATSHPDVITKLIENGATIFRMNFSHGSFDEHATRLAVIREAAARMQVPVAVLGDLCGPKIRVGKTPDAGIMLKPGQDVIIRPDAEECIDGPTPVLAASYPNVATDLKAGHRVLIDDGRVRMLCVETSEDEADRHALCRVTVGGRVTTRKGINLPDSTLRIASLTEHDWACVAWGVERGLDFFALSFVRDADDVRTLRRRFDTVCTEEACGTGLYASGFAPTIPIVAKIETPQAVDHIDEIIDASDGIMVARGDLGVEMDLARVPVIQKQLVRAAHALGRPCIVATQMLESMIDKPTATRAEVSDVANAILDGADAVMLSAETAVGRNPDLAVETMRRVADATEQSIRENPDGMLARRRLRDPHRIMPALAHGAWHMARDIGAKLIVVWSQTGGMARHLSQNGFRVPILAFTSDEKAARRMCLLYGVFPLHCSGAPEHRSDFAAMADKIVLERGLAQLGDPMVYLAGKPLEKPGAVNTVAIRFAGEFAGTKNNPIVD